MLDASIASKSDVAAGVVAAVRGGLIASCQPVRSGRFDVPEIVEAFGLAAVDENAVALRIESTRDVARLRSMVRLPIVGLVKRPTSDCEVYITPAQEDAADLIELGADVVAFDATDGSEGRDRSDHVRSMIAFVHSCGRAVMADVATVDDGIRAARLGADLVATTLSGFTQGTRDRRLPDLALVEQLAVQGIHVVAEGGLSTPEHIEGAFAAGAHAVTVGTGFSRPELLLRGFVAATPRGHRGP